MRGRSGEWLACWAPALFQPRRLLAGEVEVWRASLNGLRPLADALSPDEVRRAQAMGDRQARRRFEVARRLLRHVLSTHVGEKAGLLRFERAQGGKPLLACAEDVRFSVAHSGDAAVIAVARGVDVGVDVEMRRRRLRRPERLAGRMSVAEHAALGRLAGGDEGEMRETLVELWTRKEAFLKCTGEGVRRGLASFDMAVGGEARLLAVDGSREKAGGWSVRSLHSDMAGEEVFCTLVVATGEIGAVEVIDV